MVIVTSELVKQQYSKTLLSGNVATEAELNQPVTLQYICFYSLDIISYPLAHIPANYVLYAWVRR